MTAQALKNHAASVRARLLNHARANKDDYQRVLTRYAIERLLFRLGRTEAADQYVLKGAMLFVTWPAHVCRPTGDLDLLGQGNPEPDAIKALFTEICQVELPEDGIAFDPATLTVEAVREADKYQGVTLQVRSSLAGASIRVQVDIGFGDHVYPPPRRQTFPGLLPDLPEANILMYPPETVAAEKFEAMVRFGTANTRLKDFHDMWVIARTFTLSMPALVEAVRGTLKRRGTEFPTELPVGLTAAFIEVVEKAGLWSGFLRRNPPTLEPPPFAELLDELRVFFGPVISNLALAEASTGTWSPQGGWSA